MENENKMIDSDAGQVEILGLEEFKIRSLPSITFNIFTKSSATLNFVKPPISEASSMVLCDSF